MLEEVLNVLVVLVFFIAPARLWEGPVGKGLAPPAAPAPFSAETSNDLKIPCLCSILCRCSCSCFFRISSSWYRDARRIAGEAAPASFLESKDDDACCGGRSLPALPLPDFWRAFFPYF